MAAKYPWETTDQNQSQQTYRQQMETAAKQYLNRPAFSYDLNSDPLYKQYQNQYMRQGRIAALDTMGAAAANNGGYGTSYGQMAGQQAYNSHIQQMNDRIPELYQIALDRYQNAGSDILARMNVAGQMLPYDPVEEAEAAPVYALQRQTGQAEAPAQNTGTVARAAAAATEQGYNPTEIIKKLKENGVSDARARNAVKQSQIIEQRLREERF